MSKINGYALSRKWFDFAFEKKEAKSQHTALYLWLVELNNRLGWKEEFQLPTSDTMEGLSIGNRATYMAVISDLSNWGFIEVVQASKNQYQAMVVKLCRNESEQASYQALDQALLKHRTSIAQGSVRIDKQVNNETRKQENNQTDQSTLFVLESKENDRQKRQVEFDTFWDLYAKKTDKDKSQKAFFKLNQSEVDKILLSVSEYVKTHKDPQFRKNPLTYLNGKCWEDDLPASQTATQTIYNDRNNKPEGEWTWFADEECWKPNAKLVL